MHHHVVGSLEGTRNGAPLAIGQLVVVGITGRLVGLVLIPGRGCGLPT